MTKHYGRHPDLRKQIDLVSALKEKLVTVIGIPSEIWQLGGILGG